MQAGNSKTVDHLIKLDSAKERLQLFKADLLEEGSLTLLLKVVMVSSILLHLFVLS